MKKIFVIYHDDNLIDEFINQLNVHNDAITYATKFSSNEWDHTANYMSTLDVKLAVKNNSILYIITRDYISTGITIDEFYNNDMCFLHYDEFNEIADVVFNKHDILVIWIDSKFKSKYFSNKLHNDIDCLEQRLESLNYEYFLNDDFNIIFECIDNFLFDNNNENDENNEDEN